MVVHVNGEPVEVADESSVRDVVLRVGANPEAVAVAHNGEVVPRRLHPTTRLAPGDRVEVIRAVGGG